MTGPIEYLRPDLAPSEFYDGLLGGDEDCHAILALCDQLLALPHWEREPAMEFYSEQERDLFRTIMQDIERSELGADDTW